MKQLFLTSSVHAVAHDIATKVDLKAGNKLAFIDTAAEVEEGDKQWLADDRQALVDAGFDATDYTITGKTKDQLKSDLKDYHYIYLSGGNTYFLLQEMQKSGFISLIQDWVNSGEKTYIGTSAGSIVAGPDIHFIRGLEDLSQAPDIKDSKGLNFVNFLIFPHWGSKAFKAGYRTKVLEDSYQSPDPIVILTDNQYVHVTDNKFQIIDVVTSRSNY